MVLPFNFPTGWNSKAIKIMHELEVERDPLQKQLANIEQIFQEFADQYDEAANSLRDGLVPDPIPSIQLEAARKVVTDTFTAISEAGQPFDMEPLDNGSSLHAAGEYLGRVLEARTRVAREQRMLDDARQVVQEVAALVHTTNPDELTSVRNTTESLLQQLDERNLETAEHLLNGNHPVAMLAAYARHRNTLNDEEYDSFRDAIQQNYGRPLLRDIDRGRLIIDQADTAQEIEQAFENMHHFSLDSDSEIEMEVEEIELTAEIDTDTGNDFHAEDQDVSEGAETEEAGVTASYDPISEIEIDEELLDEAKTDLSDKELPPLYNEYDNVDGEDTLLPFLEGDGMNFGEHEMPEATVNTSDEENDEEQKQSDDMQ